MNQDKDEEKVESVDEKPRRKRANAQQRVKEEVPSKKNESEVENAQINENEVSELERKLAELEAENARLRDLVPTETETRKLSVTLPVTIWSSVDKHLKKEKMKQAKFFSELAKSYFQKRY
ncbi:hypothetical protein [Brevibacillus laterosporus]|uniref:hypothetical protein n=1 Tax=Brevibacillus laterosporus TaxID=1465 RepID=UPI003D2379F9